MSGTFGSGQWASQTFLDGTWSRGAPVPPVPPVPLLPVIFLSGGFPLDLETGSKRKRRRNPDARERDDEEALLLLL